MLNTEAHPFPRFDASRKRFKTGWKRIPRDKEGELIRPKEEEKKKEDEKKVDETKVDAKKEEAKVETKKEVVEEESKSKGKVTKKARVMRVPNVDKAR